MKKYVTLTTLFAMISLLLFACGGVTAVPTPTLGIGPTIVSNKDGMVMFFVPQGKFTMGSDNGFPQEKPVHTVYLDAFWIDQTEVTNAMYAKCVSSGVCKEPSNKSSFTRPSYYDNSKFDNYPVVYVDWYMAKTYCEWRGGNLPTEAQWEKAARGTDERTYPWGGNINCSFANYWGNDRTNSCVGVIINDTTKVASYESGKSPYGLYDMAGNVLEWVMDWYSDTYYQNSLPSNPIGPDAGIYRVQRGGSLSYVGLDVNSSHRFENTPMVASPDVGFRCVRSLP